MLIRTYYKTYFDGTTLALCLSTYRLLTPLIFAFIRFFPAFFEK